MSYTKVKCPACGKNIEELFIEEYVTLSLKVIDTVFMLNEESGIEDSGWYCPKCGSVLFKEMKDAVEFMGGKW